MYIRHINLPRIPEELISELSMDINQYVNKNRPVQNYIWSDTKNQKINQWCKDNICKDMYWGFQLMSGDLLIHKDRETKTKFNYLISQGGTDVITTFFNEDKSTEVYKENIPMYSWHIFKADSYHGVTGVEPGQVRFSITGRIF